eukprot:scaffold312803_cov32-Tisochrysis_lutea.AAC.6
MMPSWESIIATMLVVGAIASGEPLVFEHPPFWLAVDVVLRALPDWMTATARKRQSGRSDKWNIKLSSLPGLVRGRSDWLCGPRRRFCVSTPLFMCYYWGFTDAKPSRPRALEL